MSQEEPLVASHDPYLLMSTDHLPHTVITLSSHDLTHTFLQFSTIPPSDYQLLSLHNTITVTVMYRNQRMGGNPHVICGQPDHYAIPHNPRQNEDQLKHYTQHHLPHPR